MIFIPLLSYAFGESAYSQGDILICSVRISALTGWTDPPRWRH